MTIETETYTLPAYWASYLINGDHSGLEDSEIQEADSFMASLEADGWYCVDASQDSDFSYSNDATDTGGDVAEFTFHRSK